MTEQEPSNIIPFPLQEARGEGKSFPITEDQLWHLHSEIDPMVDKLIENLELEKVRRKLADEYMMRTIPETRSK